LREISGTSSSTTTFAGRSRLIGRDTSGGGVTIAFSTGGSAANALLAIAHGATIKHPVLLTCNE